MTTKLTWQHFPAGPNGFFRAPVLLSGPTEALLIDGGFTYPDGRALADAIKSTGKTLTAIYVSQSDPDYYFSLKPIHEAFPNARVIAASDTIAAIKASVEKKLATWGPQLKENGPQTLADVVLPEAFDDPSLTIDGETVEIVAADGLANRRYLWVPSLSAVFGGVMIFSGVHVWVADTPSKEQRTTWIANLDKIAARRPAIVVPGHTTPEATTDLSAIEHTKTYLLAFEEERAKAADSAALKAAMTARFPNLGMGVALDIGSKVTTGEMKWG
jgi:glyoxylase-like metal-dependent hydrolase (beta-lactamase superfamily II)